MYNGVSAVSLARVREPNDGSIFTIEWELGMQRLGDLSSMAAHFVHGIGYVAQTYLALCRTATNGNSKARQARLKEYAGMANAYLHFNPPDYDGNGNPSSPVFGVYCRGSDDGVEKVKERLLRNGFVEVRLNGIESVVEKLDGKVFSGRETGFIRYFEAITGHVPTVEAMQEFWNLNPPETRRFWQF